MIIDATFTESHSKIDATFGTLAKGEKGDAFKYEDFTEEQLEDLRCTDRWENHEKRITNIENKISTDFFLTDEDTAYRKVVPSNACPYAQINSIGGMTYRDEETQTLRDSKTTKIVSEGVNKFNPYQEYQVAGSSSILLVEIGEGTVRALNNRDVASTGAISAVWSIPISEGITNVYFKSTVKLIGDSAKPYILVRVCDENDTQLISKAFKETGDYSLELNVYQKLQGKKGYVKISFYSTMGVANANDGVEYSNIMLSFDTNMPYTPYKTISYPIPAEIQAIDGYGKDGFVIDLEKQTSEYEDEVNPLPVPLEPFIEVEGGGSLVFINEYENAVPTSITYLLKESAS